MSMKIKCLVIALMASLCMFGGASAFADEQPDMSRKGDITVVVRDASTDVPAKKGGVSCTQVAKLTNKQGVLGYEYTSSFQGCKAKLENLSSASLASQLAAFAAAHSVKGKTGEYDADGQVAFKNQNLGLYLITMSESREFDMAFEPFLVTVPLNENGKLVYDVVALPKSGSVEPRDPEPDKPTPNDPNEGGGSLPKTGQLWWPVPLLVGLGIIFLTIGVFRNRSARRKEA